MKEENLSISNQNGSIINNDFAKDIRRSTSWTELNLQKKI
jgi:hypothetical protein